MRKGYNYFVNYWIVNLWQLRWAFLMSHTYEEWQKFLKELRKCDGREFKVFLHGKKCLVACCKCEE